MAGKLSCLPSSPKRRRTKTVANMDEHNQTIVKGLVKTNAPSVLLKFVIASLVSTVGLGGIHRAGARAITRARTTAGYVSVAYEIKDSCLAEEFEQMGKVGRPPNLSLVRVNGSQGPLGGCVHPVHWIRKRILPARGSKVLQW